VKNSYEIKIDDNRIKNDFAKFSVLDQWLINIIEKAKIEMIASMEKYDVYSATRIIDTLIDSFSR
jgi:isoleucyl-tRNA synthetase